MTSRDLTKLKDGDTFTPSSWDEAHPGRFLNYTHIELAGGSLTLTIDKVFAERMGMKNNAPEVRNILAFRETAQQYATQKTNEALIVAMFGPRPGDLIGKRVTFVVGTDFRPDIKANGPVIRIGGSPDIDGDREVTVTYSQKSRRAPKTFRLRKTAGGPTSTEQAPADDTGLGAEALAQAVTAIETADDAALEAVISALREKPWSRDESRAIKGAIGKRRGAK